MTTREEWAEAMNQIIAIPGPTPRADDRTEAMREAELYEIPANSPPDWLIEERRTPMYAGEDRVKQIDALRQLAGEIVDVLPTEVTPDDITIGNLQDYLPEEWPSWVFPEDKTLLLLYIQDMLWPGKQDDT